MKKIITLVAFLTIIISLSHGQKKKLELVKEVPRANLQSTDYQKESNQALEVKRKASVNQDFEGSFPPFGWWIDLSGTSWDKSDEKGDHTTGDGFYARYDVYSISEGESSGLVTPVMNPTTGDNTLSFWVNYYYIDGDYGNGAELYVDLSTDFGQTWTQGTTNIIDGMHGEEWFEHTVDLSSYNGEDVTVRLRAVSDYGSYNIAIDDVTGPEIYVADDDAGISSIISPADLIITDSYNIDANLVNFGSNNLTSVNIHTSVRDSLSGSEVYSDTYNWTGDLATAGEEVVQATNYNFSNFGVYNIISSTNSPNGTTDPIFTNNSSSKLVPVIAPGMIYETFEEGEFSGEWASGENWTVYSYPDANGSYCAGITQSSGDPAEKLVTPQLSVQNGDEFIFLIMGINNTAGYGSSSLTLKYSTSASGPWTELQSFDMANLEDDPQYVSVEVGSLAGNDYYFAFEAESTFDYQDYSSYVFIDDIMGPTLASIHDNDLELFDLIYDSDFIYEGDNATLKAIVKNVGINDQTGNAITFNVEGSLVGTANAGTIRYLEKDTVSVQWTSTERGKYNITASIEPDDYNTNNTRSTEGLVVRTGQLLEGFEHVSSVQFQEEWTYGSTWVSNGGTEGSAFAAYEGDSCMMTYGDADGGSYSNIKMITPKLERTADLSKFYFYAKAVNTSDTTTTSVQLKYTDDTTTGNWYPVSTTYDLSDKWKLYETDLTVVPNGEVFFAFVAGSDWEYQDYVSYVLIDHVAGINYPGPDVQYAIPYDGDDQVALDSMAIISFDEDITEVDFSGITIEGATEGSVSGITATLQADSRTIHIAHDTYANNNEDYTVTFPAGAVKNSKQVLNHEHTWSFTTIMAAPEVEYYSPDTNSTGVPLDAQVLVRLNQEVTVSDLSGVTISGDTEGPVGNVTATLDDDNKTIEIAHDDFANENDLYTVTIPAEAVNNADAIGNEQIQWQFNTKLSGQPVADTTVPADNETAVLQDAEVYVIFDLNVTETDLSGVAIEGATEGVVNTTAVLMNDNATNPDTLVIAHDNFANSGEYYTVTVPAGAVDASGTPNDKISWQFRTLLPPPAVNKYDPVNGASGVEVDQTLSVNFDQKIFENDFSGITLTGNNSGPVTGLSAYITGDTQLNISHDGMANEEEYTVTIPSGALINDEGVANQSDIVWGFTTILPAPEAVSYSPADGAMETPIAGELSVKFNVDVDSITFVGILLEDTTGTISGIDSGYLREADSTIVMYYSGLTYGMEYTVKLLPGTVENPDGVKNDLISWKFTTKQYYNVTFNVSDQDGDPVSAATVSVGGSDYTTDGTGVAKAQLLNGTYSYTVTKTNFETASGSVTVSGTDKSVDVTMTPSPSDIMSLKEAGINIYPNPSDGRFYIESHYEESFNMKIVSLSGVVIIEKTVANTTERIDLGKYADGIYFIRIRKGEDVIVGKIIKR